MNPLVYISLFAAIVSINIAFYIYFLNPKKNTNRVFSLLVLFFAIFCISEFMVRISETGELALLWGRIGYSLFIIFSILGLHFSLVFPRKYPNYENIFTKYKYLLPSIYVTGVILVIYLNILISVQNVKMSEWGYRVILEGVTAFPIYWFLFCGFFTVFNLAHTYFKKSITINEKRQIQFLTIGILILVTFSLGTNLIPPLYSMSVFPMTTVSLMLFSFIVAYSMIKYKLMKLTTAETADVVLDTMTDSLIVVDENETIVNLNKASLYRLGYAKDELVNSPLKSIVDRPSLKSSVITKVMKNGNVKDIETEFITKEGKKIPMNVSASGIYDDSGKFEGIVIVARDLTETKIFIRKLEEAKTKLEDRVQERTAELEKSKNRIELQNIQLKKLDQLKSEFLNMTSHELRTPMSSIKGYVQMMLKQTLGNTSSKQRDALNVVLRNTNRLDDLIQDILDVSRLESGTMRFIPEKTDVRLLLGETVGTLQSSADLKNIKINAEIDLRIPKLDVDETRISQVLFNILDNAIKFSLDDSNINVRAMRKSDDVLFEVRDFGRGIPKTKHKKIFEIFYQVDSGIDRKYGGAGLGLAISRGIVLAHGGRIWVDSNAGGGSSFKFTLPIRPVQDVEGKFKEVDMFGVNNKSKY